MKETTFSYVERQRFGRGRTGSDRLLPGSEAEEEDTGEQEDTGFSPTEDEKEDDDN